MFKTFAFKGKAGGICKECLDFAPLLKSDIEHFHDLDYGTIVELEGDFKDGFKETTNA